MSSRAASGARGGGPRRWRTLWWAIPALALAASAYAFNGIEVPRWTSSQQVPAAMSIRPDAQVSAAARSHHPGGHHPAPKSRRRSPAPTPTVTQTEVVEVPAPVTVVAPSRQVITSTPTPRRSTWSDDGKGDDGKGDDGAGGSDDQRGDG